MNIGSALLVLMLACPLTTGAAQKADLVIVKKSASQLYLKREGRTLESFNVAFGASPKGSKQREGDERTPEGRYVLDSKNARSKFYKSIHISYPDAQDSANAKARGTQPGGLIMIHGQRNGWGWLARITQLFNWTDGCIALTNRDMDTVWSAVDVGTPIEIYP
jgi:murein L,D-transpeptidase YafK